MPIRGGDEQRLADAREREEQRRKAQLQQADEREARVMRQVRDTDVEGDN